LDEHARRNQNALGAQLGENVGCHIVVIVDVVELDSFKVAFKLAYLGAVCMHHIFLDVARLIDLVKHDLGVTVSYEAFYP
jgi:hypothetical protein